MAAWGVAKRLLAQNMAIHAASPPSRPSLGSSSFTYLESFLVIFETQFTETSEFLVLLLIRDKTANVNAGQNFKMLIYVSTVSLVLISTMIHFTSLGRLTNFKRTPHPLPLLAPISPQCNSKSVW